MAQFSVWLERAKTQAGELNGYSSSLSNYASQITDVSNAIYSLGSSTERIRAVLRTLAGQADDERAIAESMGSKLMEILTLYETTEKTICGRDNSAMSSQTSGAAGNTGINDNANTSGAAFVSGETDTYEDENILNYLLDWINKEIEKSGLQELCNISHEVWNDFEQRWNSFSDVNKIMVYGYCSIVPGFMPLLPYLILADDNEHLGVAKEAIGGDWYTGETTVLGTAIRSVISLIPEVGSAADVRDLMADVYHCIDNGMTADELLTLSFTAIGLFAGESGNFAKDFIQFPQNIAPQKFGRYYKSVSDLASTVENSGFVKYIENFDFVEKMVEKLPDGLNVENCIKYSVEYMEGFADRDIKGDIVEMFK